MSRYLLAIDQGTTGSTVLIVDDDREVLEAIAQVPTGYHAALDYQDVPVTPVKLLKVTVQ